MMPTRDISSVAIVGTGYFSQFHFDAWSRLDVNISAICSIDAETVEKFAKLYKVDAVFDDLSDMLEQAQPDILDVVTPPSTHLDFVTKAAERGIPTICQKPFADSLAGAEAVTEVSEATGTPVVVHENFRFQPWYREIRRQIDHGVLGDLYQLTFRLRPGDGQGAQAYLDRQPYFQKMERFLIHETVIHLIDVFRYLFGDVRAVSAHLARLNPVIAGEDAGLIIFEFADGPRGLLDGNRLSDHVAENRRLTMGEMMIEGSAGTMRLDGDGNLFIRRHGENQELPHTYPWRNHGYGGDCVYELQKHVLERLRSGQPAVNSASEYLANLRIEEAIYRAAADGRKVVV